MEAVAVTVTGCDTVLSNSGLGRLGCVGALVTDNRQKKRRWRRLVGDRGGLEEEAGRQDRRVIEM